MSASLVPFLGLSDGRLPKALKAIQKLIALGITKPEEIAYLLRLHFRRLRRERRVRRAAASDDRRTRRLARAQWAVRWMMALGFTESEIAAQVGVDHSTIAHLLDPRETRAVGRATTRRLVRAVRTVGLARLDLLLPRLAITVLDTCNDKGLVVDGATRDALAESARRQILHALLLSSAPAPIVRGVHAFLAQIGEPAQSMYLISAPFYGPDTPQAQVEHLRRLEHEAEHLVERFRDDRRRLEQNLLAVPPPPAGRFA